MITTKTEYKDYAHEVVNHFIIKEECISETKGMQLEMRNFDGKSEGFGITIDCIKEDKGEEHRSTFGLDKREAVLLVDYLSAEIAKMIEE